jgi:spermidine synthase
MQTRPSKNPAMQEEGAALSDGSVTTKNSEAKLSPTAISNRPPFLLTLVFISGMAVMATEMCGSRLIQPYFGDSLLIWANLIGFFMIYLALGYFVGGRLGDRHPRATVLYQLTGLAAFATGLIPLLSDPVLTLSNEGFRNGDGGLFLGSLFGIIVLFSVPLILMGCVSPFAVRLKMNEVQGAGKTAGTISALSTCGSILGTFLPVLLFIPTIGTRPTIYLFSVVMLGFSIFGLWRSGSRRFIAFGGMLVVVVVSAVLVVGHLIKPAADGQLLYEQESTYNYIQVVRPNYNPDQVNLILNEGHAIHSIYNPKQILTGGYWDYYMIAPFFNKQVKEPDVKQAYVLGLAAGTVPRILSAGYGERLQIDGAELDPAILEVGRKYFAMGEQKNLNAVAQDGRYFLLANQKKYDIIAVDAFRQPYIPFHLTTQEFYKLTKEHLTANGALVANIGSPSLGGSRDYRLVEALASTMRSVYPNVYIIDVKGTFNTIVVATPQPTSIENFRENIVGLQNPLLRQVAENALQTGDIREWNQTGTVFTDDWAPVERVIDQLIIDYVVGGGK